MNDNEALVLSLINSNKTWEVFSPYTLRLIKELGNTVYTCIVSRSKGGVKDYSVEIIHAVRKEPRDVVTHLFSGHYMDTDFDKTMYNALVSLFNRYKSIIDSLKSNTTLTMAIDVLKG